MEPIETLDSATARSIRAVLTDIDGTLTDERGHMPAASHLALERLQAAGLIVVPVTGRPAGWCDMIARQWAVDGVVGENGALWLRHDRERNQLRRTFLRSDPERLKDRAQLDRIRDEVLRTVPGTALASDQDYRVSDLAIDYCEDVPRLSDADVARIVAIFQAHGATAKISSIHVNGWFGTHDKLTTSRLMLSEEFALDADTEAGAVVFAGDSPNDAPMFAHFPNAFGVANVADFAATIPHLPRFVTRARGADGFAEFADTLLARRSK